MSRSTTTAIPALLAVLVLAASGCGADKDVDRRDKEFRPTVQLGSGGDQMAAADAAEVLDVRRALNDACSPGSGRVVAPAVNQNVGRLVGILREVGPDALYEVGSGGEAKRMTEVAQSVQAQLRACGARTQARRLASWVGVEDPAPLGG